MGDQRGLCGRPQHLGRTDGPRRLGGAAQSIFREWKTEADIYEARTMASRRMRRRRADLIEIFGGRAAITECAVKHSLRTLQPIDQVYGQQLRSKEDYQKLESILLQWLPFLVIWEPVCTAWCSLQHLNYGPDLRELQLSSLKAMAGTIKRRASTFSLRTRSARLSGRLNLFESYKSFLV